MCQERDLSQLEAPEPELKGLLSEAANVVEAVAHGYLAECSSYDPERGRVWNSEEDKAVYAKVKGLADQLRKAAA